MKAAERRFGSQISDGGEKTQNLGGVRTHEESERVVRMTCGNLSISQPISQLIWGSVNLGV